MSDYDLSRLSPRAFEHLVQALALKVIGPGLTVFGDGPDGAREATFEGRMTYPSQSDPWSGYLVVQTKFRQKPERHQSDSAWALRQLQSELAKFYDERRSLRRPDYYLFCTNVVLTPVHERETIFRRQ